MRPSFKVVFAEKNTCGSHEQCMRPTKKRTRQHKCKRWGKNVVSKLTLSDIQIDPNTHFSKYLTFYKLIKIN